MNEIQLPFDPFNDRTARNIRNSLSTALVSDLSTMKGEMVDQVVHSWDLQKLLPVYRDYIRKTWEQYRRIESQIAAAQIKEPQRQALALWNAGLFFELHELLETIWHGTRGAERIGLKGLIQAAGVYVHHLRGKPAAARGLAERARRNLLAGKGHLGFIANLEFLIECLDDLSRPPPRLVVSIS